MKNVMPEIQYIPDTEDISAISSVSLRNFVSFLGTCSHLMMDGGTWSVYLDEQIHLSNSTRLGYDRVIVGISFNPDGNVNMEYEAYTMSGDYPFDLYDSDVPLAFAQLLTKEELDDTPMKNTLPDVRYIPRLEYVFDIHSDSDHDGPVEISPRSIQNFVSFLGTCSHLLEGEWTAHLGCGRGHILLAGRSPKGDTVDVLFRPDGSLCVGYILNAVIGSTSYGIWDGGIPKVFAEIMEGKKND